MVNPKMYKISQTNNCNTQSYSHQLIYIEATFVVQ